MSAEILTMLGVGATLLAAGGTFALLLFRLFLRLESKVGNLEQQHHSLAQEVHTLAREVSELRGEFRGRFGAASPEPAE